MYTLYSENTGAFSLLQSIGEDKYIALQNQSYKFYIKGDTLYLDVLFSESNSSGKTVVVEKNIKADFDAHILDNKIHIVAAKRNYNLVYILFDGQHLTREIIYTFDGDVGIPSEPVIKAQENDIHIAVSFIRIKKPRAWSICSYTKKEETWRKSMIDNGIGLCYTQHCLSSDKDSNIYCLYKKYSNNNQNIMHAFYDRNNLGWCKPKIICNNGIDKYWPRIFINISGHVYFLWLEINDEINLCIAKKNINGDYDRLEITSTIQSITIWNDHYHIYAISCEKSSFFYDLCCIKQESPGFINDDSGIRRELDMDIAKVKLFLDIKRELEQRIAQMEDSLEKANKNNTKKVQDLIEENINYQKELEDKSSRIDELTGVVKSLLCEKSLSEKNQQEEEEKPDENPSVNPNEMAEEKPDETVSESPNAEGKTIKNMNGEKYNENRLLCFIKGLIEKLLNLRVVRIIRNKIIKFMHKLK